MRSYAYNQIRIFAEEDADEILEQKKRIIQHTVERETDDYILNVNEENYLDHLVEQFTIDPLQIHVEQKHVSTYEKDIPAENFPPDFHVRAGASYKKDIIKYHVPLSGNTELLRYKPNPHIIWTMHINIEGIEGEELTFEIVNFRNDPEQVKKEADEILNHILANYGHLSKQVIAFNDAVRQESQRAFRSRKEHLLKKNNFLASLGVPIKKKSNVPETFAIPAKKVKPRIVIDKPRVRESGFTPEPTLDDEVYNSILQVFHEVGRQFERLPATYIGKDEEQLRDHILLILEPNFEGSATGETFNKNGKTDILLRHEGSNVFIAECKFWRGEKVYLETINQLLGYLTWRDSKAAIVLFVSNKDFTNVLNTVKSVTPKHRNYLRSYGERDETWLRYGVHLDGDQNREVKMAVMLFHIPT